MEVLRDFNQLNVLQPSCIESWSSIHMLWTEWWKPLQKKSALLCIFTDMGVGWSSLNLKLMRNFVINLFSAWVWTFLGKGGGAQFKSFEEHFQLQGWGSKIQTFWGTFPASVWTFYKGRSQCGSAKTKIQLLFFPWGFPGRQYLNLCLYHRYSKLSQKCFVHTCTKHWNI